MAESRPTAAEMMPIPASWLEGAQRAAQMQQRSAMQLEKTVAELANIVMLMTRNMQAMETALKARMTITAAQARTIRAVVVKRARALCEAQGFPYEKAGRRIRYAMMRDFREAYGVADIHDLPGMYYEAAMEMMREWSSYSLMRQIRVKMQDEEREEGAGQ